MTRRRRLFWGGLGFVVILVALTAWIGIRGLLARGHLQRARDEISSLRAQVSNGELGGLEAGLSRVEEQSRAAKALTGDPLWSGLAHLPLLGRTLRASSEIASSVDQLASGALKPLLVASHQLDPHHLRRRNGTIDLAALTRTVPDLEQIEATLASVTAKVDHISAKGVLSPVVKARQELIGQLKGLLGTVDTASRAARIAPAMLGANGPRTYLMVFQTPAESRGTGGLVGSYAIIRAVHGKLTRERTGSNADLIDSPTPVVNLGREFNIRYGKIGSAEGWRNANFTPHYPWAAEIWQRLWERQSGQKIDGVLSVDPVALGYLLKVTGPVTLADGQRITGANAATWSMATSYALYPDDSTRKARLVELAQAMLDRLSTGDGSSADLLRALGRSAGERRLLVWSARPAEEAVISGTPLAGELPDAPGPFTSLVVRNASGDKLDFYLDRRLSYQVLSCTKTQRLVRVTATLTNQAPRSGLPEYVTRRSDGRKAPLGQDRLFVDLYASVGAKLVSVQVDGKPSTVVAAVERGHPVFEAALELPISRVRTVSLLFTEPASSEPLQYLVQPLAGREIVSVARSCN